MSSDLALSTTPSDLELRFKQATSLFATYAVAKQLTVSLPLFSPKEIGDGKAHMTRYAQDPYKATIDAVLSEYEKTRNRLVAAYNAVKLTTTEAPTLRTYFSSVLSGSDPVTGT